MKSQTRKIMLEEPKGDIVTIGQAETVPEKKRRKHTNQRNYIRVWKKR